MLLLVDTWGLTFKPLAIRCPYRQICLEIISGFSFTSPEEISSRQMRPSELGHHIGALGTLSSAGTSQNKDNERGGLLARHIRILQAVPSCKSLDLVGSHRPISAQHVLNQVQESIFRRIRVG